MVAGAPRDGKETGEEKQEAGEMAQQPRTYSSLEEGPSSFSARTSDSSQLPTPGPLVPPSDLH